MLFAGNTLNITTIFRQYYYSIRYILYANIVKKLSQGQSAGNNTLVIGTSETTRKSIKFSSVEQGLQNPESSENIKLISEHVPTHSKPITDEEFGHYLAGLIDGDGSFSTRRVFIVFNILDVSLAYYIKGRLGYGKVTKIVNKNAVLLTITSREGVEKVINLINGKLRVQSKIDDINKHIINVYVKPLKIKENLHLNTKSNLNNSWLAGFIDADGSFQIKLIDRVNPNSSTRTEVRLHVQIDQKTRLLLDLIKYNFGGNIGYRKTQDTYYYSSTSFGSARKFINYLDIYHLLSSKYLNYLKWRKGYILVQSKKHLTPEGQNKIRKLKLTMNNYSKETLDLDI